MEKALIKEFIKKIELFKGLSIDELQILSDNITMHVYDAGEFLFSENNPRKNIFIIEDGEVELFKKTVFGEEKQLCFFNKYDFLGEGSLMDDSPHSTSARAVLKLLL